MTDCWLITISESVQIKSSEKIDWFIERKKSYGDNVQIIE